MRNSLIALLLCFGFAIEPAYIQELVVKKATEQLSAFTSFNIEIVQEPYGAEKISQNVLIVESIDVKPGITIIKVKANIAGKQKELRYVARVKVYDNVLVLKETAVSNREFDPSLTEGRLIDVTALFDAGRTWVKSTEEAKGKRFKRTVKKESVLLNEALEKLPDIRKNEIVTVKIKEGGVELKCDVIALEEGYVGETIEVMHAQYKKRLQAVVKGLGTLEIKG